VPFDCLAVPNSWHPHAQDACHNHNSIALLPHITATVQELPLRVLAAAFSSGRGTSSAHVELYVAEGLPPPAAGPAGPQQASPGSSSGGSQPGSVAEVQLAVLNMLRSVCKRSGPEPAEPSMGTGSQLQHVQSSSKRRCVATRG
jgi:hypothetical protein